MLIYVNSGLLTIEYEGKKHAYKGGDCIFIRRSHNVNFTKQMAKNGDAFSGIFFLLDKKFLASKFKKYKNLDYPIDKKPIIQIEKNPVLASFFNAIMSYDEAGIKPDDEVIEAKKYEALDTLLKIRPSLVKSLFDFAKPWKIGLEEFMNKNFANDMSVEEFARYTGRSLSTFKRDFKEIFNETPHEWLKNKKLDEAYRLIKDNKLKASEIYLDLGFKTLSHFSDCFREKFGVRPTAI